MRTKFSQLAFNIVTLHLNFMQRFFTFLVFFFTVQNVLKAQPIGTGQWRLHLPLTNIKVLAETPEYLYAAADVGFIRVHKELKSTEILSRINDFGGFEVSQLAYHKTMNTLVIVYSDGLIDLVKDNQIVTLTDLQRASIIGSKRVNAIEFEENFAFLAADFGIVMLNIERYEFSASYVNLGFGDIRDMVVMGDFIYALSPLGIYRCNRITSNPAAPGNWSQVLQGSFGHIEEFQENIVISKPSGLERYDGQSVQPILSDTGWLSLVNNEGQLLATNSSGFFKVSNNWSSQFEQEQGAQFGLWAADGSIWFGTRAVGLIKRLNAGALEFYSPNGPYARATGYMLQTDGEIWVPGGSVNEIGGATFTLNGFYRFSDERWFNSIGTNEILDSLRDLYQALKDPRTGDILISAYYQGIVRLRNGQPIDFYNGSNSTLTVGGNRYISGMAFDRNGFLWVTNRGADNQLHVRSPQGEWRQFRVAGANQLGKIWVDRQNRKWIQTPRGSGFGLVVYDDNRTPLDGTDDRQRTLGSGTGNGNLPDNDVQSLAVDASGAVWVGTAAGLGVFFNPNNIFTTGGDAQQIVIGSGNDIGYLMGSETVTAIFVDGGDRKWFGTRNGAWLSSPDGRKILANYNIENSPIISNSIIDLVLNGKTGEAFMVTDKGIISLKSDATEGGPTHDKVVVFPNPVREDFDGPISIRGLVNDAYVKITDVSGNLIYETRANGGMATWDGRNFSGRRAATGVYLIFSGNADGSETHVAKVLIVGRK